MKVATNFQQPTYTKAKSLPKPNTHDDGGRVMGARMVVLTEVPSPKSAKDIDALIKAATSAPSATDQMIRVFCSPTCPPENFMGPECQRSPEHEGVVGPDRMVIASSGMRIMAAEHTQAREGLFPDRLKKWPLGTWQSLGNVFSQLIVGNPMNVWTNAVVAVVRVAEGQAFIVAHHVPEMQPRHLRPYSGVAIVVRIAGKFERLGRVTVALLSPPWSTANIRQPQVK